MVSATSWFVFVSLIIAFNITNAQLPYDALAGIGAALESLGPIGAILALESGIPLGGIPFPGGMPLPGGFPVAFGSAFGQDYPGEQITNAQLPYGALAGIGAALESLGPIGAILALESGIPLGGIPFPGGMPFPGGFPAAFGSAFGQDYPGELGSFDGAYYPSPFPMKAPDNGFNGGYPGQFPGAQPFPTGLEGGSQPTHIHISVPQDNVQVTESVTVSETTKVPNGYGYNEGFPGGFEGGRYEAAQAFLNGYNSMTEPIPEPFAGPALVSARPSRCCGEFICSGSLPLPGNFLGPLPPSYAEVSKYVSPGDISPGFYEPRYPNSFPGNFPGSLGPSFAGPLPPVFPDPIPPNFYGPVPPQYPGSVLPQVPGPVPPKFPGPMPPNFPGPVPPQFSGPLPCDFPGQFSGENPADFQGFVPPGFPGPMPPGPIIVIEECNNKGFSKMLPWLLIILISGNNSC